MQVDHTAQDIVALGIQRQDRGSLRGHSKHDHGAGVRTVADRSGWRAAVFRPTDLKRRGKDLARHGRPTQPQNQPDPAQPKHLRAVRPYERSEMTTVFVSFRDVAQLGPPAVFSLLLSLFSLPSVFVTGGLMMLAASSLSRRIPRSL
jgi:hypothetical protein